MYMPNLSGISAAPGRNYLKELVYWSIIVSLLAALASPIMQTSKRESKPAHAVMQLIDASDSMSRGRMPVNSMGGMQDKLSVAKNMVSAYIKERENDHVGIIVFGDFAYVASPLSFDHQSTSLLLERVQRGIAGSKTAMYDALFLATRLLGQSKAKEKIAILLTDGFNTAGSVPLDAALRALQSEKIRVFTIGVGSFGEYDATVLKQIAQKSGGEFFSAQDAKSLQKVYAYIDKLQKTKLESRAEYQVKYLYMYPLMLGIFAFLIYLLWYKRSVVL